MRRWTMSQRTPEPAPPRGPRPERAEESVLPLNLHNPVTQQMFLVGKRREAAEAKLNERLRADRANQP